MNLEALQQALDRATGALSRLGLEDVVDLPQAPTVSARTHAAPLLLRITITRVNPDRVEEILPRSPTSYADLLAPLRTQLTTTMAALAARSVGIGAAGGLAVALLLRGGFLGVLAGIAAGGGIPAAIFGLTAATYNLEAFSAPLALMTHF